MKQDESKRLFLLDAYALIYRAYYALIRSPRVTSKGFNTSAIFGFCNTLREVLEKENPSHIAVCFDPPHGHTFRHEMFEEYKANRDRQPEDITLSLPYIRQILDALNIPAIEIDGYEADDVIGTLSQMAEEKGYMVYMMTPDKDYGQLVTDRVFMYRPSLRGEGFEVRDPAKVCEKYGISSPRQVIDLLALEGDASDNIPGCPGVGEKTARKLIEDWGSVENLIAHASELKGALQRKVTENTDKILLSKDLATIRTDVPVDIDVDHLVRRPMNAKRLVEIYKELEFKTFIANLRAKTSAAAPRQESAATLPEPPKAEPDTSGMGSLFDMDDTVDETPVTVCENRDYETVEGETAIAALVERLKTAGEAGMSLYSTGEDAMTARWLGVAFSTDDCKGSFILFPTEKEARAKVIKLLAPIFEDSAMRLVSHDVKREYLVLKNEGISLKAKYFDTSVAHYIIDPEMKHDMTPVAAKFLNLGLTAAPDRRTPYPAKPIDPDSARERYCEAADVSRCLMPLLCREIESLNMTKLLEDVEFPLIRVLAEMEWTGVRIDPAVLKEMSGKLTERMRSLEEEAYSMAGGAFNISSPMQVGEVLFERLKIDPKAKRTARGSYSTTEQILEKYAAKVPLVGLILRIRGLRKLLSTYIDALPALVNPVTGKIHTSYNQTVTATGRISSTNPNLQNIPIRTDDGREIRRAFISDPGDLFMSADYSQIELRLIADLSGDRDMIDAFNSGADIHRVTAAKIYHEDLENVTDDQRRHAKTANFGIIYGISAFGLSERLGISRAEAKKLIDGYFATYPHIREYLDNAVVSAREQGYVTTRMGRRRYLPDINSRNSVVRGYAERNAVNAPIQGSAADIIKVAMVRIYNEMERRGLKSRMIMQVHDELIFNIKPDELETVKSLVITNMTDAYHGAVPLEVSAGIATNWLDAH
ncbi:MAG: DNA polymerase I [Duncaniella sp.]|nr:DNA polymerase I [Duncaniella sp.]HBI57644.1 DNA polymerase I [Porphyromonadaceae bacterium]